MSRKRSAPAAALRPLAQLKRLIARPAVFERVRAPALMLTYEGGPTGRDTVIDLARKQGVELPTFDRDGLHALLYAGERCASLDDYLRTFELTLSVMQTEEALERCAFELAEDAWRENVRYLEVRYSPLLHLRGTLRPSQAVERRPFGNVEIRSLGPGRGHNRPRRLPPGPAA